MSYLVITIRSHKTHWIFIIDRLPKAELRAICLYTGKDSNFAVPFFMFAVREVSSQSLRFSPSELVFDHRVRGPLDMVKEG